MRMTIYNRLPLLLSYHILACFLDSSYTQKERREIRTMDEERAPRGPKIVPVSENRLSFNEEFSVHLGQKQNAGAVSEFCTDRTKK